MSGSSPLRMAVVAGEESGDLLGADLVTALAALSGREIKLTGVGGRNLAAKGLVPLFDGSEIALMGFSSVVKDLPRLIRRIGETARAVVAEKPDCLVTIDSPDFSLRVAKKVRAADPSIPIIHYVCPSVWAWRPGRAVQMRPYVDAILCILPFEPDALESLGGPPGIYVGHRLASHPGIAAAAASQAARVPTGRKLLVLPGSRKSEVRKLIASFGNTVETLAARGSDLEVTIPTVPHVAELVRSACASWKVPPRIVIGDDEKWKAFGEADAALAASGTVLLELALAGVPSASCYRTDVLFRLFARRFVTAWSAALPNLIADYPVLPEFFDVMVREESLARHLEQLMNDTLMRAAQKDGFEKVVCAMATSRPSGEIAAEALLSRLGTR